MNAVWPESFGREVTNRKAIAERGWFPFNRNLALVPTFNPDLAIVPYDPEQKVVNFGQGTAAWCLDSILMSKEGKGRQHRRYLRFGRQ